MRWCGSSSGAGVQIMEGGSTDGSPSALRCDVVTHGTLGWYLSANAHPCQRAQAWPRFGLVNVALSPKYSQTPFAKSAACSTPAQPRPRHPRSPSHRLRYLQTTASRSSAAFARHPVLRLPSLVPIQEQPATGHPINTVTNLELPTSLDNLISPHTDYISTNMSSTSLSQQGGISDPALITFVLPLPIPMPVRRRDTDRNLAGLSTSSRMSSPPSVSPTPSIFPRLPSSEASRVARVRC